MAPCGTILRFERQDPLSARALLANDHGAVRHSLLDRHGAAALAAHGRPIAITATLAVTTLFPPTALAVALPLAVALRLADPHAYAGGTFDGDALSDYARSRNGCRKHGRGGNDEQ